MAYRVAAETLQFERAERPTAARRRRLEKTVSRIFRKRRRARRRAEFSEFLLGILILILMAGTLGGGLYLIGVSAHYAITHVPQLTHVPPPPKSKDNHRHDPYTFHRPTRF